jgi:flagellar hook protein FlgE
MRIESAIYASREGLDAHGKAISVIGDNISNSNTIGFRASRIEFADLMSGGLVGGANGTENPSIPSTGSGVTVQQVRQLQTNGVIEYTSRDLDVAIDGNGFFLLGDPDQPLFSRAGNFEIDEDGYLASTQGYRVLGLEAGSTELSHINMAKIELDGEPTTSAVMLGNLQSTAEVTEVPEDPETFTELNQSVSYAFNMDVYDSLGTRQDLSLYFFKTDANEWQAQAYVDGSQVGGESGVPVMIGEVSLSFNEEGELSAEAQEAAVLSAQTTFEGAAESNFTIDLTRLEQFAADPSMHIMERDGQAAGAVESYEFSSNGEIVAVLDSGSEVLVGTLQLGSVQNVDGLDRGGHGMYTETEVSGERRIGSADSMGFGSVVGSSLERSAVDISTEFVNLTLYQRGYQANAQVLSATNTILRDTINLMR